MRGPGSLIGESPAIRRVLDAIDRAAPSAATVLILGESGTGKELVARRIHELSAVANGPFVTVNCSAIPDTLVESELFGHKKGAFTGADKDRAGKFRDADRGTLFLDEIGDMAVDAQAKLLRVLQEGEVEPLGGGKPVSVDVRVVAATHRDLKQRVEDGTFREDLFFRLKVVDLPMPPLRERAGDIVLLAQHFLADFGGGKLELSPEAETTRSPATAGPGTSASSETRSSAPRSSAATVSCNRTTSPKRSAVSPRRARRRPAGTRATTSRLPSRKSSTGSSAIFFPPPWKSMVVISRRRHGSSGCTARTCSRN